MATPAPTPPPRQLLYQRLASVTVAVPVPKSFSQTGAVALTVTDLRVSFNVKKTSKKEPNKAEVVITNLNSDHRALLQTKGGKFILQAGYASTGTQQLFVGDVRDVAHVREGADWNTTLHSGDGERAYRFARTKQSFKANTAQSDVLNALATEMGVDPGNLGSVTEAAQKYANGFSSHGVAQRELDRILSSLGYTWSIQDGAISVLKYGATLQGLVPLWSVDTGLIGSPEFGAAEKNKGPQVKAKHLLDANVRIGGQVKLQSVRFNGAVRVTELTHTGDTFGGDWYTEIEGVPL